MHNDHKVKPLHIMLHIKNTYVKSYDERAKWLYLLIEDDDFLEKYNTIWDKVSADIKKEFGSKPAILFFKSTNKICSQRFLF